jgi:hypothetical protein
MRQSVTMAGQFDKTDFHVNGQQQVYKIGLLAKLPFTQDIQVVYANSKITNPNLNQVFRQYYGGFRVKDTKH